MTDSQTPPTERPHSFSPEEAATPSTSTETTLSVGETCEFSNGSTVTVNGVRISKLIRSTSVGSSTHIDVACLNDHQFAVIDTEATDADGNSMFSNVRFALEVDDRQYPRADQHWYWAFPPNLHDRPGLPAFPAPISDATTAAVIWLRNDEPSVRWKVSTETVDLLGQAPSFTVQSFEAPDSVSRETTFQVTFTVANTGERDGRFVAEFGAGPLSDHSEVTVDVPGGTERSYTGTLDPCCTENEEGIDVTLEGV